MKRIIATLLVLLLGAGIIVFIVRTAPPTDITADMATTTVALDQIQSFEDCAAAGLPVMESNPRQCATPDGRTYAEEIAVSATYSNASADRIRVENPFPGAVTGKMFTVMGEARGNWYFEASFPVEVRAADGSILASTYASAQGDWMTENFVPFTADVSVAESYTGPATLILRRDNPSGLPEQDASVSFPITIEY